MIIDIIPLVVLSLASYRITRFFVIDTLLDGLRTKLHVFLVNKAQQEGRLHLLWDKAYQLFSCTWCLGFHISWLLWWVYSKTYPWDFGLNGWISVFAIAGIQGFLHALEPNDD